MRSRARWRWAGPNHRPSGGGGDWAAASIYVSKNRLENAGPGQIEAFSSEKVCVFGAILIPQKPYMKPKVKNETSAVLVKPGGLTVFSLHENKPTCLQKRSFFLLPCLSQLLRKQFTTAGKANLKSPDIGFVQIFISEVALYFRTWLLSTNRITSPRSLRHWCHICASCADRSSAFVVTVWMLI